MKSFFKYLLASILGVFISITLLFLIFFSITSLIISSKEKSYNVKPNSILYLKLDQPIVDRKPSFPFDLSTFRKNQKIGLNELLEDIHKAKNDDNIKGIHLDLSYINAGIGTIDEIRNALLDFRKSGKFVTAYSSTMTQAAYYLSTAANKIYLNPMGFFSLKGLRVQGVFFKKALDKLDIKPIVIKRGAYKSFGEPFTHEKFSKANRKQLKALISTIWDNICRNISKQRNITPKELNYLANNLVAYDADSAYKYHLVDSLIYRNQLLSILKKKTGIDESKDLHVVTLSQYSTVPEEKAYKGIAHDKIAVIYASGDIVPGEGTDNTIGSARFGKAIRKARRDSTIKAVVVRVNSPGGSAIASDELWHELELTRKVKPVVVSMGDVAASGGYYMSCAADSILAQPSTITGSIGVISIFVNAQGFFNRFGVTFDAEKTNKYSDFMSGIRPMSAAEKNYWKKSTDKMYRTFVSRVEQGRHMTFEQVDTIGEGHVWSGIDAKRLGLIDRFGGLEDAIQVAKNMAHLGKKYRIVELPRQEEPLQVLMKELTEGTQMKSLEKKLGANAQYLGILRNLLRDQGLLARMPMDIRIE